MNKLKEDFKALYNKMNGIILPLFLVSIAIGFIFDIVPHPYVCEEIEELFSYDLGNLLSIALTVWSFGTALMIFYVEYVESLSFGMRLKDTLHSEENYKCFRKIGILFVGELLMLIFVTILEFPITMTVLTILLCIFMLYAASAICFYSSAKTIIKVAEKEYDKMLTNINGQNEKKDIERAHENYLLHQMIARLDYENPKETKQLVKLFEKVSKENDWGKYQYLIKYLLKITLKSREHGNDVLGVLQEWFTDNDTCINCKREIIKSLIRVGDKDAFDCYMTLMSTITDENKQRKMLILAKAYNTILKDYVKQQYRDVYIRILDGKLGCLRRNEHTTYRKMIKRFEKEVGA